MDTEGKTEVSLEDKTKDELMAMAKEMGHTPHHSTGETKLRALIEAGPPKDDPAVPDSQTDDADMYAEAEKRLRMEETIREKLRLEAEIRDGIAKVRAEAQIAGVTTLDIPAEPTLTDVVRLKKELGMEVKKPKPSPETLAIENSKKGYYVFRNLEEKGVDIKHCPGGKYWFHHFHGRLSVLPDYLLYFFRTHCVNPIFQQVPNPSGDGEISVKVDDEPRFMLEPLGEAPEDAKFGVVTDLKILEKFGMGPKKVAS